MMLKRYFQSLAIGAVQFLYGVLILVRLLLNTVLDRLPWWVLLLPLLLVLALVAGLAVWALLCAVYFSIRLVYQKQKFQ
ncbi:hypothetical protein GCM10027347_17690 [Larkinella harenae]